MKKLINTIAADRITRITTIVAFSLLLVTLIYSIIVYGGLPPYLPLFNQMGWGDPRLGEKYFIFIPLLFVLIVIICNMLLTSFLYATMPLISRMMTITSLLISALTLIFIIRVTQLVL